MGAEVTILDQNRALAKQYLQAVSAGELPDYLLTSDMTGWITSGGLTMEKAQYQNAIRMLSVMLENPLEFKVQSITCEEDRAVIEATSRGQLINGEEYQQTYVFILRLRDGKIAAIAEHYNPAIAQDKLVPLMAQAAAILEQKCSPAGNS